MSTTDPETLTHIYGVARSLSRLKKLLLSWKPLRTGNAGQPTLTMPAPLVKEEAIKELNGSLDLLEQAFQEISALKTKLEAQRSLNE